MKGWKNAQLSSLLFGLRKPASSCHANSPPPQIGFELKVLPVTYSLPTVCLTLIKDTGSGQQRHRYLFIKLPWCDEAW